MRSEYIREILDDLGGGSYRRAADHWMSLCPLSEWSHASGREKAPSFGVLLSDDTPTACHCFNVDCPATGTLFQLIEKVGKRKMADAEEGWDARRILELQLYMTEMEQEEMEEGESVLLPKLPIEEVLLDKLGEGSDYWRDRGVDERTILEWRLFEHGGRAFMPIMDRYGEVVGMQGRLLPELDEDDFTFDIEAGRLPQPNKYRTFPPRFERDRYVAGEHLAPGTQTVDFLIVVESPADAIFLNAWMKEWWAEEKYEAFPSGKDTKGFLAVATMGADFSDRQVQKVLDMLSLGGECSLGFDRDKGGIAGAAKWARMNWKRFMRLSVIEWERPDPSDRGEDGDDPMEVVRQDALNSIMDRESWLAREVRKRFGKNYLTKKS